MQLPSEKVDLFSYDFLDREFSILNCRYTFKFKKIENEFIDELEVWLRQKELFFAEGILKSMGIHVIEDLVKFDHKKMCSFNLSTKQVDSLKTLVEKELEERTNNLIKREAPPSKLNKILIEIYKEMIPKD